MATFLFANNAQTRLAGPITSTATTCNVAAGTGALFPQPANNQFFALTLLNAASATAGPQGTIWEIVYVTAVTGDTLTITRAQENTQAEAWNAGDIAANLVTAGTLRSFAQSANLSSSFFQGTDTSGDPNNMTVTATVPANNAPTQGQVFFVTKGSQANTGNMTLLTPSAGTREPVINADGSQIAPGAWPGSASGFVTFTGTVYQLTGILVPPTPLLHFGDDTSTTANQITVSNLTPSITAYSEGQRFQIKLKNSLTGPGANANLGLGSITITRADGTPTQANDGVVGQELDLICTGGTTPTLQIAGLQTALTQGRLLNVQVFSTAGTYTYTKTPGMRSKKVFVVGAGGAGTGGPSPPGGYYLVGAGGGGGGIAISVLDGTDGYTITVGAKGVGTTNGGTANAASGGTSSFGSFLSATGGLGSTYTTFTPNGAGGVGAGGGGGMGVGGNFFNGVGQGGNPTVTFSGGDFVSGAGGGAGGGGLFLGFGGSPIYTSSQQGTDATVSGTGGSGAGIMSGGGNQRGGSGLDGYVRIEEYS